MKYKGRKHLGEKNCTFADCKIEEEVIEKKKYRGC